MPKLIHVIIVFLFEFYLFKFLYKHYKDELNDLPGFFSSAWVPTVIWTWTILVGGLINIGILLFLFIFNYIF